MADGQQDARKKDRYNGGRRTATVLIVVVAVLTVGGLFGWFGTPWVVGFAAALLPLGFWHLMVAFRAPTRRNFTRDENGTQVSIRSIREGSDEVRNKFT